MGRENKLRDQAFGKFAEDKAVEFYISQGYAIKERNWRWHKIEIDIIAQYGNIIVFVEVKARSGRDMSAAESVTMAKMKNMTRGADVYLKSLTGDFEYRYDIFTLTGDFENYVTESIEDAFISPLMK
ncbi:MAG: YraN family protein [Muribaculaceae bacterium]|nr:YraN family protein [Muribaculaceae bacterium]MDE5713835.1 YraN family protein [Muribaculaceae bacterium]